MKRSKNINHHHFRKVWREYRLTPVAMALSAVFMLSGCEKADQTTYIYKNANECSQANPSITAECTTAYNNALIEAQRTAPKYESLADCAADFGAEQCTSIPAAQTSIANADNQPQQSFFMPIMAGYMLGRLSSGGYGQSPLFTSSSPRSAVNGKFVDATGRDYGPAQTNRSMRVNSSALAPKPTTTSTVTRGGFGNSPRMNSSGG